MSSRDAKINEIPCRASVLEKRMRDALVQRFGPGNWIDGGPVGMPYRTWN